MKPRSLAVILSSHGKTPFAPVLGLFVLNQAEPFTPRAGGDWPYCLPDASPPEFAPRFQGMGADGRYFEPLGSTILAVDDILNGASSKSDESLSEVGVTGAVVGGGRV